MAMALAAAAATPFFPAGGYGGGGFATTFQGGRHSLSPAAMAVPFPSLSLSSSQRCSFGPVSTMGKYKMRWCLTRSRSVWTTAINWLCRNGSSSSSSLPRGGKFSVAFAGNWSSCGSCRSGRKDLGELLLIPSHPLAHRGRNVFVAITTAPFKLQQRRAKADSLLNKFLKISASSTFSWLQRKRRVVPDIRPVGHLSTGCHWRMPALHRFFRFTSPSSTAIAGAEMYVRQLPSYRGIGTMRATSDYYNNYDGASLQAAGSGSLENASLLDQQQQSWCSDSGSEFLATGYGWRVRDALRGELEELIRVADIQTNAFHERSAVFDALFYKIFHAEILSSLQYKTRHFAPDRYACLLAEMDPLHYPEEVQYEESYQTIVGAVDVTASAEKDILCHLPGADEYLYVSGMAVDSNYRRRSVATLLLKACLARALEWGINYLVLHAYEDDFRARNLYSKAGYHTVAADPAWMTKFLGRRRRVVLAKRIHDIPISS